MHRSNLKIHFSFFGILLYSTVLLLLSPFQKSVFVNTEWQLESISMKNRSMEGIDPCIAGSENSIWFFQEDGTYQSGEQSTLKVNGTWKIKGRSLHLMEQGTQISFWISQLSEENLILKTRTEEGCLRIHFVPLP